MTASEFVKALVKSETSVEDMMALVPGLTRKDAAELRREAIPFKRLTPIRHAREWPPQVRMGAIAAFLAGWRFADKINCGIRIHQSLRPERGMACFGEFEGSPLVIDEAGRVLLLGEAGQEDWPAAADQSSFLALYAEMAAICGLAFRKQADGITLEVAAKRLTAAAGGKPYTRFCQMVAAELPLEL